METNQGVVTGSKPHARDASLDILKGICILFVIVTHFSWTGQERLGLLFPFWIDAAVPLFMMVSGLCYARSYANRGIVFLEAYRYRSIADKVVRYTVPFLVACGLELMVLPSTPPYANMSKSQGFF